MTTLSYQSGYGNQYASEAIEGTLPQGRNSPQKVARGLYAELLSGSAFTAPRAENRRTWMYRRQPSVVTGRYAPFAQPWLKTGAKEGVAAPPNPLRWHPVTIPDAPTDFLDGLRTVVVNGDADAQTGMAAHLWLANRPMGRRAFVNADGEMLLVPQQGAIRVTTELGSLDAKPGEIVLVPRGLVFKVDVDGPSRDQLIARQKQLYGAGPLVPDRRYLAIVDEARCDRAFVLIGERRLELPLRNMRWAAPWSATNAENDHEISCVSRAIKPGDVVWVTREVRTRARFREFFLPDKINPSWRISEDAREW